MLWSMVCEAVPRSTTRKATFGLHALVISSSGWMRSMVWKSVVLKSDRSIPHAASSSTKSESLVQFSNPWKSPSNRAPESSRISCTCTSRPAFANMMAAASPDSPAPMMWTGSGSSAASSLDIGAAIGGPGMNGSQAAD